MVNNLNIPDRLKSRKLWLAVLASVVTFGNYYLGWGLTVQEVTQVISPLLAYIGAEGLADALERYKAK